MKLTNFSWQGTPYTGFSESISQEWGIEFKIMGQGVISYFLKVDFKIYCGFSIL